MALFDGSGIGNVILAMNEWTGDWFISLFFVYILIFVTGIALRIPTVIIILLCLPFAIVAYMLTGSALILVGAGIFYVAIVLARMFM